MTAVLDSRVALRLGSPVAAVAAVVATAMAMALVPVAGADPEDCDESLIFYDPHDLVLDTDVLVDVSTLTDVESLVDDYTEKIDEALDAEFDNLEPPDGVGSDDLIDEARWEIEDAVDLGRSIAGCEDRQAELAVELGLRRIQRPTDDEAPNIPSGSPRPVGQGGATSLSSRSA